MSKSGKVTVTAIAALFLTIATAPAKETVKVGFIGPLR